ncbi:hypothetical protein QUA81_21090 [Microcoleus sp. F6_B4]
MHKFTYFFNPLFLPHVVQAVGWHAQVGGYLTKANGKFSIGASAIAKRAGGISPPDPQPPPLD